MAINPSAKYVITVHNQKYKVYVWDILQDRFGTMFYEIRKPYRMKPFVFMNPYFMNHEKLFLDVWNSGEFEDDDDLIFVNELWHLMFPNRHPPDFDSIEHDVFEEPFYKRGNVLDIISRYFFVRTFI